MDLKEIEREIVLDEAKMHEVREELKRIKNKLCHVCGKKATINKSDPYMEELFPEN